jgi:hypothetical protein
MLVKIIYPEQGYALFEIIPLYKAVATDEGTAFAESSKFIVRCVLADFMSLPEFVHGSDGRPTEFDSPVAAHDGAKTMLRAIVQARKSKTP